MNALLLNRDGFQMPADGWYQVAPLGEFAHAQAGLTQVVDLDACKAMANRFAEDAKAPNFAGLLVDFDHFSLDGEKRSEAAGWITALENRDGGLFAKIRWSDVGEEAVKGGRYRFLSPVWNRADCVDLGGGRVRPVRLLNAAVTNDPNLKGMVPLSNRAPGGDGAVAPAGAGGAPAAEPRFKWVLGDTVGGAHCPSCTAMAGQTHTMDEWDAGGVKPGDDSLFCQGNCQCRLDPTDDASDGPVMAGPVRKEKADVTNMVTGAVDDALRNARMARGDALANVGWTDEARAASLAVRQAKAGARGSKSTGSAGRKSAVASILAKGYSKMTPAEVHQVAHALQEKAKTGADFTPEEMAFLQDSIDDPNAIPATGIGGADGGGKTGGSGKSGGKSKKRDSELGPTDYQTWFEEDGLKGMPQKAVNAYTDQLREKMAADDEPLTETETKFLGDLTDSGYEGLNNDDPITQWQTDRAKNEKRIRDATGMSSTDAASSVAAIETKMDAGQPVTPQEEALADAYHKAKSMTNRARGITGESSLRARAQREVAQECADLRNHRVSHVEVGRDDAVLIGVLVNTGWTDQARVAALAVRQAKAGVRTQTVQTQGVVPAGVTPTRPVDPGKQYVGGTPNFDESTGQYTYTQPASQVPPGWNGTPTVPRSPGKSLPPPYVPPVKPGAPVKPSPPVKVQPPIKGSPPVKVTPPVKGGPVPVNPPPYQFYRKPLHGSGAKTRAV